MTRLVTLKTGLFALIGAAVCLTWIYMSRTPSNDNSVNSFEQNYDNNPAGALKQPLYDKLEELEHNEFKPRNHKRQRGKNDWISNSHKETEFNYGGFEEEALNSWKHAEHDPDNEIDVLAPAPIADAVPKKRKNRKKNSSVSTYEIQCDVNDGRYHFTCKKEGKEVFIPFSFLSKYYEVVGRFENGSGNGKPEKFIWQHSTPKIFYPKSVYDPKGSFTFFDSYNVEVRDRVKCINGAEGVPMSTQWDVKGYFYPIQIAQFGLAHYSKYILEGNPIREIIEDGDQNKAQWSTPCKIILDPTSSQENNHVAAFQHFPEGDFVSQLSLPLSFSKRKMLTLSWAMKLETSPDVPYLSRDSPSVLITANIRYENEQYFLHYVLDDFCVSIKDNHIYHGLGSQSHHSWHHIIRDLSVDLQKGIAIAPNPSKIFDVTTKKGTTSVKIVKAKITLESLSIQSLYIRTLIDNLTLSTNEHLAHFFKAASWFVNHQDERGGWPIPVQRKFSKVFYPVLAPGWYSAMGQGHALSVLARAHYLSSGQSDQYANACSAALQTIFDRPGTENGVKAVFMEKYSWYEEYPTNPSTFVLNGFMYALLGLYDVKTIGIPGAKEKATILYSDGIESLKAMLPLYDTGSGTLYDLRHFTAPGIPPNLARVDYHSTHINQLLTFATFESDPIFKAIAKRWISYTKGERAPHN